MLDDTAPKETGTAPPPEPVAEPISETPPPIPVQPETPVQPEPSESAQPENEPIPVAETSVPQEQPIPTPETRIEPVSNPTEPTPTPESASQPTTPPPPPVSPFVAFTTRAKEMLINARAAIQTDKRKKLEKIMTLLAKKQNISNDDVEKLLHVSDATATRYLAQLEQEGKITQHGISGQSVYYTLK